MLTKALACAALFLVVVGAHAAWISTRFVSAESGCGSCSPEPPPAVSIQPVIPTTPASCDSCAAEPSPVGLSGYIKNQDYFLGLSYGLSGAFAWWALLGFFAGRKGAMVGAAGGITWAGILSAGGCGLCFFTGCCGSPMLAVYASFLGGTVLRFAKPLAFGVTLLSVAIGFWWLARKNRRASASCNCGDGCCGT